MGWSIFVIPVIPKGYFGELTIHSSRFRGNFGHFIGFQVLLVVLEILSLFWSIKRFRGFFFGHFVIFWVFWSF